MNNLIDNLFLNQKFIVNNNYDNFSFWRKEDQEYYLVVMLNVDEFKKFDYKNILDEFNELKKERSDIEKNTSLIVFVSLNNLKEDFSSLKNKIMDIEENEYWFKKYVVVYSNNSFNNLKDEKSLNDTVFNNQRFDTFKNDPFIDEEYFLVMQLFMKIPFLKMKLEQEKFSNLYEVIDQKLTIEQRGIINDISNIKIDSYSRKVNPESIQTFFDKYENS